MTDEVGTALVADVNLIEALGSDVLVHFSIDAERIHIGEAAGTDELGPASGQLEISGEGVARVDPTVVLTIGQRSRFAFDPNRLHFFDPDTGDSIWS